MVFRIALLLLAGVALVATSCTPGDPQMDPDSSDDNPFLTESTLLLKMPAFDQIEDGHFAPAFEVGMSEHAAEIITIAEQSEPPTLENTLVALERSGQVLQRVSTVFFALVSANTNDACVASLIYHWTCVVWIFFCANKFISFLPSFMDVSFIVIFHHGFTNPTMCIP